MIKRYGFGQRSVRVGQNTSVGIPDLVEREDGDYVRYDDFMAFIESIGAGGVSGQRITKGLTKNQQEE